MREAKQREGREKRADVSTDSYRVERDTERCHCLHSLFSSSSSSCPGKEHSIHPLRRPLREELENTLFFSPRGSPWQRRLGKINEEALVRKKKRRVIFVSIFGCRNAGAGGLRARKVFEKCLTTGRKRRGRQGASGESTMAGKRDIP